MNSTPMEIDFEKLARHSKRRDVFNPLADHTPVRADVLHRYTMQAYSKEVSVRVLVGERPLIRPEQAPVPEPKKRKRPTDAEPVVAKKPKSKLGAIKLQCAQRHRMLFGQIERIPDTVTTAAVAAQ